MRRSLRLVVAGVAAASLTAIAVAPAGAQETLGFEIDPVEGPVGSTVDGFVDTDDVAEHCTTDVETFVPEFQAGVAQITQLVFGNGVADPTSYQELVAAVLNIIAFVGIVPPLGDPELAEDILGATFVMTFADIATQQPVGETGSFDPNTGEGSVVVPDVEPGFWAVAAACVSLTDDPDAILAAVDDAAAFAEANLDLAEFFPQLGPGEFPTITQIVTALQQQPEFLEALVELGPAILLGLMEPDAIGVQIFCVFDEAGVCPEDAVPPPVDGVVPPTAEPVVVEPVFTG